MELALDRTLSLVTLWWYEMWRIARRWRCWVRRGRVIWGQYSVHVSAPYRRVDVTIALYTAILVLILMLCDDQRRFHSLPNDVLAQLMRLSSSLSMVQSLDTVLPRYLKLSTVARGVLLIVIGFVVGELERCITSVFFVLMKTPKDLVAAEKLSIICWRDSSELATKAQSSAYWSSHDYPQAFGAWLETTKVDLWAVHPEAEVILDLTISPFLLSLPFFRKCHLYH